MGKIKGYVIGNVSGIVEFKGLSLDYGSGKKVKDRSVKNKSDLNMSLKLISKHMGKWKV